MEMLLSLSGGGVYIYVCVCVCVCVYLADGSRLRMLLSVCCRSACPCSTNSTRASQQAERTNGDSLQHCSRTNTTINLSIIHTHTHTHIVIHTHVVCDVV